MEEQNSQIKHLQSLDLARSIAAIIVFVGHLLFIPSFLNGRDLTTKLLAPVHTGAIAVLFFFALSGFVLSKQIKSRKFTLRWLSSRLIRLLPVYYVAWVIPFLYLEIFTDFKIKPLGVILGFTASQSFSPQHSTEVNAPLWSLSVEIWLSLILLLIWKFQKRTEFISLLLVVISLYILFGLPLNPIITSLPFFLLGIIIEKFSGFLTSSKLRFFIHRIRWTFAVSYLALSSVFIELGYTPISYFVLMLLVAVTLVLALNVAIPIHLGSISNFMALRSYSLYAIHYPIILVVLKVIKPTDLASYMMYVLFSCLFVALATEITFRLIDNRAVKASRIFWNK